MREKINKINHWIFAAAVFAAGFGVNAEQANSQETGPYQDIITSALNSGIDEGKLTSIIQRAQERDLTREQFGRLLQPAINLAGNDLPYEPVLQKALEGLAKRVPHPNIIQVLGNIETGMNRSAVLVDNWLESVPAREMIRTGSPGQDMQQSAMQFRNILLENTSAALQQNIREENITGFLDEASAGRASEKAGLLPVASAVGIMADLPTAHSDPGLTRRILVSALRSGFTANEIQQLPAALNAAQLHSRLPAEAVANGMAEQALSGIPATTILENLFKGNLKGGPPGFTPPGAINRPGRDGEDAGRRPPVRTGPPGN
jgi:hypothetical protein